MTLENAGLKGADLENAGLKGANLENADLVICVIP
ncbi:MAG: pentapeptide repeat-containing protein [Mogibacterium sp.]|nr:pentapeptide repeat-containing protein [Mogibacterium sp.]